MNNRNTKVDVKAASYKNRLISNNFKQDKLSNDMKNMHIAEPDKLNEVFESYKPECNGAVEEVKENGESQSVASSPSVTDNQQYYIDVPTINGVDSPSTYTQNKLPNHSNTNNNCATPSNPIVTPPQPHRGVMVSKDLVNIGQTSASTLGQRSNIKIHLKFLQESQLNIENKRDSIETTPNEASVKSVSVATDSPLSSDNDGDDLTYLEEVQMSDINNNAVVDNEEDDTTNDCVLVEEEESPEKASYVEATPSSPNICVNPVCCTPSTLSNIPLPPSSSSYYSLPTASSTASLYMNDGTQFNNGTPISSHDFSSNAGQIQYLMRFISQQHDWALLQQQMMNNNNQQQPQNVSQQQIYYPSPQSNPTYQPPPSLMNNCGSKPQQHVGPSSGNQLHFIQNTQYSSTSQQSASQAAPAGSTFIPFIPTVNSAAAASMNGVSNCAPQYFYPTTPASFYPTNQYYSTPNSNRSNGPIQHTGTANPSVSSNNPTANSIIPPFTYLLYNPYYMPTQSNQFNVGSTNHINTTNTSTPLRLINNNGTGAIKPEYSHNNYNASSSSNSNYQR